GEAPLRPRGRPNSPCGPSDRSFPRDIRPLLLFPGKGSRPCPMIPRYLSLGQRESSFGVKDIDGISPPDVLSLPPFADLAPPPPVLHPNPEQGEWWNKRERERMHDPVDNGGQGPPRHCPQRRMPCDEVRKGR